MDAPTDGSKIVSSLLLTVSIRPSSHWSLPLDFNLLIYLFGEVLVLYEYCVTFTEEVELFWNNKVTGATVLFLGNRYMSMAVQIYSLILLFPSFSVFTAKVSIKHRVDRLPCSLILISLVQR